MRVYLLITYVLKKNNMQFKFGVKYISRIWVFVRQQIRKSRYTDTQRMIAKTTPLGESKVKVHISMHIN
jgi:hypothetical protein